MENETQLVHQPNSPALVDTVGVGFPTARWGRAIRAGFQVLPNVLFRAQQHLELDSSDVVILANLAMHWWGPNTLPFPSPTIIARRMGVSRRTVERRLEGLEKRGFIKRLPAERGAKRRYDLSGMVQKLESAALVGIAQREFAKQRASEVL
jgi:DNA-binding MarR family transcriptional regulator